MGFVRNVTSERRNTNMTKRGEFLQFLSVHRYTYSTGQLFSFTTRPRADSECPTRNTHKTADTQTLSPSSPPQQCATIPIATIS